MDFVKRPPPATDHMTDYDRNSTVQDKLVRLRAEKIAALVARIGPLPGEFRIQDYGCGPGHTALDAVRPAIEAYRRASPDGPVVVRHSDQPGNDWNGLLALAFGSDGYHDIKGVRTEMAAGSFYDVLAAPGSIALATSFAASHWLSRAIHPHSPGAIGYYHLAPDAQTEMRALAEADWRTFLRCRAAELMPGGFLLVGTLGSIEDPAEPTGIRGGGAKFVAALAKVLDGMAADDLIDAAALDRFVLPFWFLTTGEATRPIATEPDLAEAFEVVEAEVTTMPVARNDIYSTEFDDPEDYGRRAAGYVRAFSESSMRLHLFPEGLPEAEIDARIDECFRRLAAFVPQERSAANPFVSSFIFRRR